jgi:hypothetical protein
MSSLTKLRQALASLVSGLPTKRVLLLFKQVLLFFSPWYVLPLFNYFCRSCLN